MADAESNEANELVTLIVLASKFRDGPPTESVDRFRAVGSGALSAYLIKPRTPHLVKARGQRGL